MYKEKSMNTPILVTTDKVKRERIRTALMCSARLEKGLTASSILEDINGTRMTLREWAISKGKNLNEMYDEYVYTCDYILIK